MSRPPDYDESSDEIAEEALRVEARVSQMIAGFWHWHVGDFSPAETWSPAVNVYRLKDRYEICVDLAGLARDAIRIEVEPTQVTLQGSRPAPEPRRRANERMKIVSMEIDHGRFVRRIALGDTIDVDAVRSDYRRGYLWIHLPLP